MDDLAPAWRSLDEARSGPTRVISARSARIWAWTAGLVVSVSLFLGLLTWYRPSLRPAFLPLYVVGYESPLIPPPLDASRDRRALVEGGPWARRIGDAPATPTKADLLGDLDRLSGTSADEPVVVYLGGVALVGPGGMVAVLPSDARLDRPDGWLPLRAVLEKLRDCPSRGKLLILDILGPPPPEATLMFPIEVSPRIEDELREVDDPGRLVLCPCSPGQVSTSSEALGGSAFVSFLLRGLGGGADGQGSSGLLDLRVTAVELADYLADRVDAWAVRNRGVRQVPRLLVPPKGFDFDLASLRGIRPASSGPEGPRAYPDWLLEGWRARDALADRRAYRRAPREFRAIEAVLFHAEVDWRGGADPAPIQARVRDEVAALRRRIDAAGEDVGPPPSSLAQERARGRSPSKEFEALLAGALDALDQATASGKPEDLAKAQAQSLDTLVKESGRREAFDVAASAWKAALDPGLGRERLRSLGDFLGRALPPPGYVETSWLGRMAGASRPGDGPPMDQICRSLRAVDLGEAAYLRPRSILSSRGALDLAAQARHDAEVLLKSPGFASPDGIGPALDRSESALSSLAARQAAIEGARDRLDDALVLLQDVRPDLERRPDLESAWRAAFREASALSRRLGEIIDDPPGEAARFEPLRNQSSLLVRHMEALRRPYLPGAATSLIGASTAPGRDPSIVSSIEDRLASLLPRAEDRARLWEGLLRSQATAGPNRPAIPSGRPGPSPVAARRRASRELLRFGAPGRSGPQDPPSLFQAWNVDYPRQFDAAPATPGDRWRADRRFRVAPLAVEFGRFERPGPTPSPVDLLRAYETSQVRAWLFDHDRYEALDPEPTPFYAVAAEALRPFAGDGRPDRARIEFPGPIPTLDLTVDGRPASGELGYKTLDARAPGPEVAVEVVDADRLWMRLEATRSASGHSIRLGGVPNLDLDRFATSTPSGFLVAARVDGRAFHARVPVRLPRALEAIGVRLRRSPEDAGPAGSISLRPNQPAESFFLALENPTPVPLELLVALEDAEGRPLSEPALVKLGPRSTRPIPIKVPKSQPATGPQGSTEAPELPCRGPLRVVLRGPGEAASSPVVRTLPVSVLGPREYVHVISARFTPAAPSSNVRDRLEVAVRWANPIPGPGPSVELVLDPAKIPGLLSVASGTLRTTLGPDGGPGFLFAEGLTFAEGATRGPSSFTLSVDGDPRGFELRSAFPSSGGPVTPLLISGPRLSLEAPEAAPSGPLPVRVAGVDAPEGSTIELALLEANASSDRPDARLRLDAPRDRRTLVVPLGSDDAAKGGLGLAARVGDWAVNIPAGEIEGRRLLRARLLGPGGTLLSEAARAVLLERRPPSPVVIFGVPDEARKGSTLALEAAAGDSASGISAVDFFLGPIPDVKPAPSAMLFPARRRDTGTWAAEVKLPDATGPARVGVRFRSRAGLDGYASATLRLLDSDPVRAGRVVGRIGEGERPQPGLSIELVDGSGSTPLATKSGPGGRFAFEGVKPGTYKARAAKPDTGTRAESDAFEVKPGATSQIALDLSL